LIEECLVANTQYIRYIFLFMLYIGDPKGQAWEGPKSPAPALGRYFVKQM